MLIRVLAVSVADFVANHARTSSIDFAYLRMTQVSNLLLCHHDVSHVPSDLLVEDRLSCLFSLKQ